MIALTSFAFVFLGAASQLGEIGSSIALVIAFILTLVDSLPLGEIATRGLLYAWQMAVMPMALMIVFNLVLGTSPHRLLRQTVVERLEAAATAPTATVTWLPGAARTSYQLLLAVAALPAGLAQEARAALSEHCRAAAAAIRAGGRPPAPAAPAGPVGNEALRTVQASLDGLTRPNGGTDAVAPKPPFLAADAFSNPDYQRYTLKTTAAAVICYLTYSLIAWQGIHTAMITCYVAALGTTGETVHKLALRISGCLVGAAIGLLCILFVIPHLGSVGGLMVLVFFGVLPGAWVSAGNERISHAGVQVGLAFLLTILNGFAPSLDMASARDRVVGILLGNLAVYLIFTGIWPKSAVADVRDRLARVLAALSRLAALEPAARAVALDDAARVEAEAEKACEQLRLLPFEPASQRPAPAGIARLHALIAETRALLPPLMFCPGQEQGEIAQRLSRASAQVSGTAGGAGTDGVADAGPHAPGSLAARVRHIEQLAAR